MPFNDEHKEFKHFGETVKETVKCFMETAQESIKPGDLERNSTALGEFLSFKENKIMYYGNQIHEIDPFKLSMDIGNTPIGENPNLTILDNISTLSSFGRGLKCFSREI